ARCPACRRAADRYPAGYVELAGAFLSTHQEEILNLIRNLEEQEKQARPLERIMAMEVQNGRCYVTTTGVHLARRIGEALARAYQANWILPTPTATGSSACTGTATDPYEAGSSRP
ncbi:BCAM0308 family protein, partial [Rhodothermus marinus]|uniref:BCAM0308 family protein n=1 Tax=Rhodothermus marinus TaxID=29549 RepID=UPI0023428AF3